VGVGKKLQLVILLFIALGLLAGCGPKNETAGKAAPVQMKIGVIPIEDIMPLLVAEKNGYFTQENLQVDIVRMQSAVEQINAMQSRQLDGMVTDMIVAAMLKDSGQDIKITSITLGVTPKEGRFAIVAAPGSDIKTIADLKGKTVGIAYNTIVEYILDGLLADAGINPSEVVKTSIPKIPLRMEMLFSNQIDAIVVPDPLVTFAEFKGAKIVAQDTEHNLSQAVVLLDSKILNEKKGAAEAFYRAYEKAVEDLNNHPEEYKQMMIDNVNIPEPIAKDYSLQRYPKPQLPAEEDVNNILQWMKAKNLLKNDLKYSDLVLKI
jgi:NitT/TauT family transport system substrate-binding protein